MRFTRRRVLPLIVGILVAYVFLVWFAFPRIKKRSRVELIRLGTELIERVGGSVQVCRETDRLFDLYSKQNYHLLSDEEATNFPALSGLGHVRGVWSGDPSYVSVRHGDHLDGAFIQIVPKSITTSVRVATN